MKSKFEDPLNIAPGFDLNKKKTNGIENGNLWAVLCGIIKSAATSPYKMRHTTDDHLRATRKTVPEATTVFVDLFYKIKSAETMEQIKSIVQSIGPLEAIGGIPCVRKNPLKLVGLAIFEDNRKYQQCTYLDFHIIYMDFHQVKKCDSEPCDNDDSQQQSDQSDGIPSKREVSSSRDTSKVFDCIHFKCNFTLKVKFPILFHSISVGSK